MEEVVPYKTEEKSKKAQVADMFNNISSKYDFLNHFLSLGIDVLWRRNAINMLKNDRPKLILDVATGTGDFAIEALKLSPSKVTGVDISKGMLEVGRAKLEKRNLQSLINLEYGDSENLPFEDNKFDAVVVAFGVRNFESLKVGLAEMYRVLRKGGKVVILEFSSPKRFPFNNIYNFYFKAILPKIGSLISKDSSAYTYLPESVQAFPDGEKFIGILNDVGYTNTLCKPQTFGISTIYVGQK
jgi:demethylmenaquinone methyltransferase/2-methoxy-6-polyprenyl-1,4-benzoquinol methylase